MFVLMVAVVPPLLSDQPPEVPRRAGLGDRFHYFRGISGRRYLFSAVRPAELADFRSAVALLARRLPGGRLAAYAVSQIDSSGRLAGHRATFPDTVALVHLLAPTDDARRDLLADLAPTEQPLALAA